jgi:hypothetical protein
MNTPWGPTTHIETLDDGVLFVSTARHGGFYLAPERNETIPIEHRRASWNHQGIEGWYEEDVDWCIVALRYPEMVKCTPEQARATFDRWLAPKIAKAEVAS